MLWLVLWCGSGAIVGWAIGLFTGRRGLGVFLGMFCGVFGWLMLLGADPRERALNAHFDIGTNTELCGASGPD